MGTRNRAFAVEDDMRNGIDEIPSISKHTQNDGVQMSKYVSEFN